MGGRGLDSCRVWGKELSILSNTLILLISTTSMSLINACLEMWKENRMNRKQNLLMVKDAEFAVFWCIKNRKLELDSRSPKPRRAGEWVKLKPNRACLVGSSCKQDSELEIEDGMLELSHGLSVKTNLEPEQLSRPELNVG